MFRRRTTPPPTHELVREHGIIAGVCGGLGAYFGISPWLFRLLFVILFFAGGLPGILLYAILWIAMPKARWART